jgi:small subunit ribosomal protein S20
LANTPQAKKRARQGESRRQHNASRKSSMRTSIKKVIKAITEKSMETAQAEYRVMASMVDKLAAKKMIHPNKAARHKSRLSAHIKALAAKPN